MSTTDRCANPCVDARVWDRWRNRWAVPDHISARDAGAEAVTAMEHGREITDVAAVTIASWWQTPAGSGAAFAALSTVGEVNVEALRRAAHEIYPHVSSCDRQTLDMLSTWALNHPSRLVPANAYGWPLVRSNRFQHERQPACIDCGSRRVMITGLPMTIITNRYETIDCRECGAFAQRSTGNL